MVVAVQLGERALLLRGLIRLLGEGLAVDARVLGLPRVGSAGQRARREWGTGREKARRQQGSRAGWQG